MAADNPALEPPYFHGGANLSRCDTFVDQSATAVIFPVFLSLLFLISVCGNGLILYVICQRKHKCNSTSIYMLNLALSDSLFTLALPARIIYYSLNFNWPFGDLLCRITSIFFFANTYAGIAFMTCISLDRYLAVMHPQHLQSLRSVRVVRRVCCLVWALVTAETAPLLFLITRQHLLGRHTCMEFFNIEGFRATPHVVLLACVLSFCCPLVVIVGCYAKINLKLRAAAARNPLNGGSRRKHRANAITILILLTFVLCFSPYHVNVMQFMVRTILQMPTCREQRAFKVSLRVTVSLMNLNCALDPVIYFFAIKKYKQKVMSLFRGRLSASDFRSKTSRRESSGNGGEKSPRPHGEKSESCNQSSGN